VEAALLGERDLTEEFDRDDRLVAAGRDLDDEREGVARGELRGDDLWRLAFVLVDEELFR